MRMPGELVCPLPTSLLARPEEAKAPFPGILEPASREAVCQEAQELEGKAPGLACQRSYSHDRPRRNQRTRRRSIRNLFAGAQPSRAAVAAVLGSPPRRGFDRPR